MKTKQLIWLVVILGVLSALVIFKQLQKPAELATQEYVPLEIQLDPAQVASLEVIKPAGSEEQFVDLRKEGDEWKLHSLAKIRADQDKINDFLQTIQGIEGELRAQDKSVWKDFSIQEDAAVRVTLKDASGKVLLEFYLGLKKAGPRATFIRRSGSDAVYLTPAELFPKIGIYGDPKEEKVDNQFWASTVLVDFNADTLEGIEVKHVENGRDSVRASVVRQPSAQDPAKKEWIFTRAGLPFELDAAKVKSFASSFQTWRAQRVMEPVKDQDYGFEKSTWQLMLKLEGGRTVTVKAGNKDKDSESYFMQASDAPVIFLLSPYYYENMDIDDARFFADNPLKAETAKLTRLAVKTDKGQWEVRPKDKTWASLDEYITDLKNLSFAHLVWDAAAQKKAKSPSKFSVEVESEGAVKILDFGDVTQETPKEYAVVLRGTPHVLAAGEVFRMNLFDKADRLKEPPPAETPKTEDVPPSKGV